MNIPKDTVVQPHRYRRLLEGSTPAQIVRWLRRQDTDTKARWVSYAKTGMFHEDTAKQIIEEFGE